MRESTTRPSTVAVAMATLLTCIAAWSASWASPTVYAGTGTTGEPTTGRLYSIDVATGVRNWSTNDKPGSVEGVAAARSRGRVAFGTTEDIYLLNADGKQLWRQDGGVTPRDPFDETTPVAISEDGDFVVFARAGSVDLFARSGALIWSSMFSARSVAMTWDGDHIVAGGPGGVAYWTAGPLGWTLDDKDPVWETGDSGFNTLTVAISRGVGSDPIMMSGSSNDAKVHLFDSNSATPLFTYTSPYGEKMSVDVNPDGSRAAACDDDPSNSEGAQLEVFWEGKDGSAGWGAADGVPLWSFRPSTEGGWDCRAIDFTDRARGTLLASVGSGWPLYEHSAGNTNSTPAWTGTLQSGNAGSLEFLVDNDHDWVIYGDPTDSDVYIYDALGSSDPTSVVLTNANAGVRALSGSSATTQTTPAMSLGWVALLVVALLAGGSLLLRSRESEGAAP